MIPHRILEESALEKIALVEIKAVSPFKAEAVKIAGQIWVLLVKKDELALM